MKHGKDPLPAVFTLIRSVKCPEVCRGLRNNLNNAERKMKMLLRPLLKLEVPGVILGSGLGLSLGCYSVSWAGTVSLLNIYPHFEAD